MFQCTDCEKTFERDCNLTKHKEKKHPDVTLANPDDTVTRELEVENTFIAQAAVNEDGIQFAKDIGTQSDFTQQYLIESAPDFSEDLGQLSIHEDRSTRTTTQAGTRKYSRHLCRDPR